MRQCRAQTDGRVLRDFGHVIPRQCDLLDRRPPAVEVDRFDIQPQSCQRAATVDALYRETETDVEAWRKDGAQIVNMETSALYAASLTCGVSSVWIGHISDRLVGGEWEEWTDLNDMTQTSAALALEMLAELLGDGSADSSGAHRDGAG